MLTLKDYDPNEMIKTVIDRITEDSVTFLFIGLQYANRHIKGDDGISSYVFSFSAAAKDIAGIHDKQVIAFVEDTYFTVDVEQMLTNDSDILIRYSVED